MAAGLPYATVLAPVSPMTRAWWSFLRKVSLEFLLELYLDAFSLRVKSILGKRHFGKDDLLQLPRNWKTCKLRGCYVDVITGSGVENRAGYDVYVGSSTRKWGIRARMNDYESVKMGRRVEKRDHGAHLSLLRKDSCQINLRLLATLSPISTPRPYVNFLEKVLSVYLQTLQTPGPTYHEWATPMALYWTKQCTPRDLLPVLYMGLNRACQLRQGLYAPKGPRVCFNCQASKSDKWFTAVAGRPFFDVICTNCYQFQRTNKGHFRPRALQELLAAKQACPKPVDNKCQECHRYMQEAKTDHSFCFVPSVAKWICSGCYRRTDKSTGKTRPTGETRPIRRLPLLTSSVPCSRCKTTLSQNFHYDHGLWTCEQCTSAARKTGSSDRAKPRVCGPRPTITSKRPCMDCGTTRSSSYMLAEPIHHPSPTEAAIRCRPCYDKKRRSEPRTSKLQTTKRKLKALDEGNAEPDLEDET